MSVQCYDPEPEPVYEYDDTCSYTPVVPHLMESTHQTVVAEIVIVPTTAPQRPALVLLPSVTDTPLQRPVASVMPIVDESVEFAATAAKVSTDLSKLVAELNCRGSAGAEESLKRIIQAGRFIRKILRYEAKRFGGVLGQPRLFEVT